MDFCLRLVPLFLRELHLYWRNVGIRKTDSIVATAIRTIVVLIFSWLMVFITGSQTQIASIEGQTWLFLILSGLATGGSWLCYFKALQLGDINKVVPVD